MKINFVLLAALAAPLLLVGCQKEFAVDPNSGGEGIHEIAVRTVSGSSLATRSAVSGTVFPDGYDMVVSAYRNMGEGVSAKDASANYFEGIKFTSTEDLWHADTPKYWPLTGNLDFLAVATSGYNTAANGIAPACVWNSDNVAKEVVMTVPDNSSAFDDILFGGVNGQTYMASGNPIVFRHAESAVVFTASSNVAYNAETNVGVTIDSISVNGAKYSGTLTVTNPAAGATEVKDSVVAAWSNLGTQKAYVKARVWDSANLGTSVSESVLTGLNLTATSTSLATKPFGEGYVILPEQDAVPFTMTYTIHNGKDASGAAVNNQMQYKYTPKAGSKWEQGKKHVYDIIINLSEVTVAPSVIDWDNAQQELIEPLEIMQTVAQYSVSFSNQEYREANGILTLPDMTMTPGTMGEIDWGDGTIEHFGNDSVSESIFIPSHEYKNYFYGSIGIRLISGSLNAITEDTVIFNKFTVINEKKFSIVLGVKITFSSSDDSLGSVVGPHAAIEGCNVTLKAVPEVEESRFCYWRDAEGVILSTDSEYTFTVNAESAAVEYTAFFSRTKIAFSSNNIDFGTVSGPEGVVEDGNEVTLTASSPNEGYRWICWCADGNIVTNNAEYTFEMTQESAAKEYIAYFAPIESLGFFTVNESGKKIVFAPGNLYANVVFGTGDQSTVAQSVTSFGFEAEQWYYRTWNNGVEADQYSWAGYEDSARLTAEAVGKTPAGTVGSFYWTENALEACSKDCSKYAGVYTDPFFASVITVNGRDWSSYNRLELAYLIDTRPGNRFAKVYVNDIYGLLIFPDGWTGTEGVTVNRINQKDDTVSGDALSTLSFEELSKLQKDGVVFLPAAGQRYRNMDYQLNAYVGTVLGVNTLGIYWPNNPFNGGSSSFAFSSTRVGCGADYRNYGHSIRPVFEL